MASGISEVDIDRSADDVWKVAGDFAGLASWMPGIEKCTLDGDVRTIEMSGMEIGEKLVARDDAARAITYSIVSGPAPVEHHEATITVTPKGAGSHVTWSVDVAPDEMLDLFTGIYQQSLDALKAHVEG
ncbi:MAG TPA: SRPBCC family protein [Acidimicrobiia bacterium]|jgi:carbon monoxide dehydrogenase subunit G|nr:SRPBCC family protein [Acidimicrobiia bacterium]